MKKILTICMALFTATTLARADEGMWFLKLMKQQHLEDSLRKAGLQLPPEALYSETAPSLRECIGIFGGGCTGEVVSADGLVLTNHHCGFSYVHDMSGIGHDYMKDGYFAHSRAEELRTPESLTFTFVVRVVDVTDSINARAAGAGADTYTAQSQAFLRPAAEEMLKASDLKDKKGMRARIVPFFGANRFYLFYEQTYSDIRLVANPPYNVGQFGGNSDNWIWPRQNADFALFRIYADKDGQPAPYSPDNVPLRVRKYLPISLRGVNKDDYTMIIVDIPTVEERGGRDWYETIPLSIIITQSAIITVCMQDTPVLHPFMEGTIRGFNTYMKTRFILQILYRNATMYLRYLRIIDRESDKLELKLRHSMQNREILMLLELSKTLVYFTTSLKSNEIVMEKLTTLPRLKQYPEDEDLLDDVITENKQAIEMANIYSGVLANMTDAFASIVSNNLNNVMRIFTIISITLSIPTLIFSMYGMNFQEGMLGMPLTDKPWGFAVIIGISLVLSAIVTWFLTRSRMFK